MQKAMQLLQQRDKKLFEVARGVGYESDAAFSRAFKRIVGVNPGEFARVESPGQRLTGVVPNLNDARP